MIPQRAGFTSTTPRNQLPERQATERLRHSAAWLLLRKKHLSEQPLCEECKAQGKYAAATDVDHRNPHRGDERMFFDPANLQSLCKQCHSKKTAREDGGFGNPIRREATKRERL